LVYSRFFLCSIRKIRTFGKVDPFGALDIAFLTAGVGFDNSVLKVLALSDNKTMAFGNFTKFNGVLCNRIARLADDGSIDTTFNSGGWCK
jgi:hypothetical protein